MKKLGIALLILLTLLLASCASILGGSTTNAYTRPVSTPLRWYPPAVTATPVPTVTNPAQIPASGDLTPPTISVSIATNCRYGPSADYPILLAFFPGDTASVIGKYTPTNYWVITTSNGYTCWLWGQNAIVTGNINSVPDYPVPNLPIDLATSTALPSDAQSLVPTSTNTPFPTNTPQPPPPAQNPPPKPRPTPPPPPQPKPPKPPKPPKFQFFQNPFHIHGPNQNQNGGGKGFILSTVPFG